MKVRSSKCRFDYKITSAGRGGHGTDRNDLVPSSAPGRIKALHDGPEFRKRLTPARMSRKRRPTASRVDLRMGLGKEAQRAANGNVGMVRLAAAPERRGLRCPGGLQHIQHAADLRLAA